MPESAEFECGDCRHHFRVPEGMAHDTRLLMCPACGSIDLNLVTAPHEHDAVWTSRESAPATHDEWPKENLAS